MPTRARRPCAEPGCSALVSKGSCPQHTVSAGYDNDYRAERKRVLSTAQACAICGEPERNDDPFQADHVVPLIHGGGTRNNLRAVHRSCNIRRGRSERRG